MPEEPGDYKRVVAEAGFRPADRPRVGRYELQFRIGNRDVRNVRLGVVALATADDGEAAVLLDDDSPGGFERVAAPVLTVAGDGLHERDMHSWIEGWLGCVLVDYAQRL